MTPPLKQRSPGLSKNLSIGLWFMLLSTSAAVAAYYIVFTGFSNYDDEGHAHALR